MFSISRRDGTRSIQSQFSGSGDPFFLVKIVKPPILWVIHHQFGKSHPTTSCTRKLGPHHSELWGGAGGMFSDSHAGIHVPVAQQFRGWGALEVDGIPGMVGTRIPTPGRVFNDCMSTSQAHAAIDSERSNSRTVIPQRLQPDFARILCHRFEIETDPWDDYQLP